MKRIQPHELTEYQRHELSRFLVQHTSDYLKYKNYEESSRQTYSHLEVFECESPRIVAVVSSDGNNLKLLYPIPRPVSKDPLFQHAESINESGSFVFRLNIKNQGFAKEYSYCLDAPNELPAGACAFFSTEEDAYGAYQLTIDRPGKYDDQKSS